MFPSERFVASEENLYTDPSETEREDEEDEEEPPREMCVEPERPEEDPKADGEAEDGTGDWDEVSSQVSSASSEDYTVILPDCFDTTRPLGGSMYSSAVSQHGAASSFSIGVAADPPRPGPVLEPELDGEVDRRERERDGGRGLRRSSSVHSSVTHMLCASQTLDAPALVPEVVPPPVSIAPPVPPRRTQR